MKACFLSLLFALILHFANAQSQETSVYKPNAILFRLNESTVQMESYQRRGDDKNVAKLKQIDKATHLTIMNDFKSHFSFCPVYFFYEKDLESVIKRDWDKIIFMDTSFAQTDKKIKLDNVGNFFIAEINYPPSINYDTIKTAGGGISSSVLGADDGAVASHNYYLLLYNDQYKLLPKPFRLTDIVYRKYGLLFGAEEKGYRFVGASKLDEKLKRLIK